MPPYFQRALRLPLACALFILSGCVTQPPVSPWPAVTQAPPPQAQPFFSQTGMASFYGGALDGKTRADGGVFDPNAFTAAHPKLAFGTVVRVTNLGNTKMVKVAINDRGPKAKGRIIDLSAAAARALGMEKNGLTQVKLDVFRADQPATESERLASANTP